IYGTVTNDENHKVLIPLDGQQRLTTLFLLYWYFNVKEKGNLKKILSNFSYETRISARDFTRAIVQESITFEEIQGVKLSEILIEKKWFHYHWLQDPTVKAMLVMLDAMHEKFESLESEAIPLLIDVDCPITFQFLELEEFGLGEELYIKMNARGKPLSTFENFKAQFEQILEKAGFKDRSKDFSFMLEKEWTDLLWEYRSADFTIDRAFVELFSFLSTSITIKDRKTVRNPRIFSDPFVKQSDLKSIYKQKENVDFLFATLSLWKSQEGIHKEFNEIANDIPLFITHKQLFDACVNNELTLMERIYLYTIIQKKLHGQEADLADTLRIIRNLVQRIRQVNSGQINSNLRFDTIGPIFRTIDKLIETNEPVYEAILLFDNVEGFGDTSWKQEQEKAQLIKERPELKKILFELEDISLFQGAIQQLLPIFKRYPNETVKYTKSLLQLPDTLISRAMLTIEDYAIQIGWSNLGPRYVFGGHYYRQLIWTNNSDLTDMFTKLYELLMASTSETVEEKLNDIIENNNKWPLTHWAYYFVRYPSMLRGTKLLYAYEDEDTYAIERLTGVNLQSDHINPFYDAVISEIDNTDICSYGTSAVRLSDKSRLVTSFGVEFQISEGYWTFDGKLSIIKDLKVYEATLTENDLILKGVSLVRYAYDLAKTTQIAH
ncbi:MAG: sigF, partial [Neobacillus sp.]|nr:sigF [Neobacillus sp.]